MIRANVIEERGITMSRFVQELNDDIIDVVKLNCCVEMEKVVHLAIKVEQQLKRKGVKKSSSNLNSSSWKESNKKDSDVSSSSSNTFFQKIYVKHHDKPKKSNSNEIKYFKCLEEDI